MSYETKHKGRKRAFMNWAGALVCDSTAPGINFRTDFMKPEEIAAESSPVEIIVLPKEEIDAVFEKARQKHKK